MYNIENPFSLYQSVQYHKAPAVLLSDYTLQKNYKRAIKRGLKIELLEQVVALLAMGEPLPDKNRDHDLSGDWAGHRECHILPDWLLVYRIEDDVLVLTLARTGTHSDLFGK